MSEKKIVAFEALINEEMLNLIYDHVLLGHKVDRGFKVEAYESVAAAMIEKSNGEYIMTKQSIVNRSKLIKKTNPYR